MDPNQVRAAITEELTTTLERDLVQSDSLYASLELANEVDRQMTRAQVDAVLGQVGQAATRDKITWIEDTIGQVQQHADSAQTAVSIQAAIKQMAQFNFNYDLHS
jgi:predicted DNA-binding transcriptional regulator YafY